jgi:hypothetical protein
MDEFASGERNSLVRGNHKVPIRWRNVDHSRFEAIAVARFPHAHAGVPSEQLRQNARVTSIEVLDDHDGGWKTGRQYTEHALESA